ncbi:hypothetical protein LZG74_16955 [Dyadobacter sp. CY327]|uniref:hypothetical protein n=1 Tax=Dyadobacter sp. CY327 TaxID=2907301 RepID=UPI001F46EF35|nr:hypothetical protein [Dyadobacter sp. CY327]MCE7072008.1 hypothetical protein [Dyadobacter sp. CY327]
MNNAKALQAFTFSAFNTLSLSKNIHDVWVDEMQRTEDVLIEHAAGGDVPKVKEAVQYRDHLWKVKELIESISSIGAEDILDNWVAEIADIPD